jgi:endonuclease YncB( thermonuclease family)
MAAEPAYTYRAELVELTDSDTMVLRIDAGFRIFVETPVRLFGIDAPEKRTVEGKAAATAAQQWLEANPELVVQTMKAPEKFGRWLGVVRSAATNEALNDLLVAQGHAKPYDGRGPRPTHQPSSGSDQSLGSSGAARTVSDGRNTGP